jgi:hypothetical protein
LLAQLARQCHELVLRDQGHAADYPPAHSFPANAGHGLRLLEG